MKTYNLILKGIDAVTFPKHVNKTVQLLVKKLCRPVPTQRLGYLKEGVEGIKRDRWAKNDIFMKYFLLLKDISSAPICQKLKAQGRPQEKIAGGAKRGRRWL